MTSVGYRQTLASRQNRCDLKWNPGDGLERYSDTRWCRFEFKRAYALGRATGVAGVRYAVKDGNFREIERADAVEAGDVDPVLRLIGTPLVVRINPAMRAKEMPRGAGIEAVAGQNLLAANEMNPADFRRNGDRAAHPTIGAGTTSNRVEPVAEFRLEPDRAAVTLAGVNFGILCHQASPTVDLMSSQKFFASPGRGGFFKKQRLR
jgi:hypothetical protein